MYIDVFYEKNVTCFVYIKIRYVEFFYVVMVPIFLKIGFFQSIYGTVFQYVHVEVGATLNKYAEMTIKYSICID